MVTVQRSTNPHDHPLSAGPATAEDISILHLSSATTGTHDVHNLKVDSSTLPPVTTWNHRPIYIKADASTGTRIISTLSITTTNNNSTTNMDELPVGIPIAFESDLFVGHVLFRFRSVAMAVKDDDDLDPKDDDPSESKQDQHDAKYFEGRQRLWQYVVQGRFKRPIQASKLYTGDVYTKPLKGLPPSYILKPVGRFLNMMVPGIHFDITNPQRPCVLALYGGTVQTLRMDPPGQEPDLKDMDIMEETMAMVGSGNKNNKSKNPTRVAAGAAAAGSRHRKRVLSNPTKAAQHVYDTHHIYTFDHYDHIMDYGTYQAHFGASGSGSSIGMTIDLTRHLDGQPMAIGALLPGSNEWMFRFQIFHERGVLQETS